MTIQTNAYDVLNELGCDIEAVELLVDLVGEIVIDDSHRTDGKPMDAKIQGQVIVLFEAMRARLAKAQARNSSLFADHFARAAAVRHTATSPSPSVAPRILRRRRVLRSRKAVAK